MESKKGIRKRVLDARNDITEKEWEEKSHCIYEKVVTHPFFLETDTIFCYVNFQKEVDTCRIIKEAWNLKKKVAVPKVEGDNMRFYYIQDFSELQSGYRGILEPLTDKEAEVEEGLVIVPGVAFDKNRNRIGYGKGYYDKYLSQQSSLKTIAIAFDMQIVEKIPEEINDIRPNILITEEHIYV